MLGTGLISVFSETTVNRWRVRNWMLSCFRVPDPVSARMAVRWDKSLGFLPRHGRHRCGAGKAVSSGFVIADVTDNTLLGSLQNGESLNRRSWIAMFNLRIGFNIFPYRNTRSGGMLYYALAMLRELAGKIPEQVTLFCGSHSRKLLRGMTGLAGVTRREIREPTEIFDYRHEFDILFTPATWGGIGMLDCPTIHVIPDVQEYYYPQYFSGYDLTNRLFYHPWVAKSSTLLITISNYSKNTIVEKLGVPEEKVRVTHLAAHPIFSDESERGVRPSNMPDVRSFLFYPSNSWHHKNHIALLDALVELRKRHGLYISAVLSGDLLKGDYNHVDIPAEIRARELENQVFHIGRVDLRGLKFLYLNAAALIHPSLFEGFGIPLVEAMSSGCPVIAAQATSIPEVCGEGALYFDPHDHFDIAAKIQLFFDNPDETLERCRSGKKQARRFSEEKTVAKTLEIMNEAYELAGDRAVEKRIRSRMPNRRIPLLSVLFSTEGRCAGGNCSALTKLVFDLSDLVQLICVGSHVTENQCHPGSRSECISVNGSENRYLALNKAMEVARGRYLCFAEGDSIPLRSFVFRLADMEGNKDLGEMLHGESYSQDPRTGRVRERALIADDDGDALKTDRCSSLSFVVRLDVFKGFLNASEENWGSFRELALALWPACQKRRIYTAVNCISTGSSLGDLVDRLARRIPPRSMAGRLVGTQIGRFVCIQMLRVYRAMPSMIREIVRVGWRVVRGS
jgi:glycosyltransferase involved in cell wall biosynthesis